MRGKSGSIFDHSYQKVRDCLDSSSFMIESAAQTIQVPSPKYFELEMFPPPISELPTATTSSASLDLFDHHHVIAV
jgi:hypothetical protein